MASKQLDVQLLVDTAMKTLDRVPQNQIHQVVSAAFTKDSTILTAFNVTHYTGGPCAEQALLGAACAQGYLPKDLTCIVAVSETRRAVINPCGKCRQIMLDLCGGIKVVVRDSGGMLSVVGVQELLPFPYPDRTGVNFTPPVMRADEAS
jgi:cytidine deaminase